MRVGVYKTLRGDKGGLMNVRNPTFDDYVLMTLMTGGVFLVGLIGCYIYVGMRAFIRRFIKKMPDWGDF